MFHIVRHHTEQMPSNGEVYWQTSKYISYWDFQAFAYVTADGGKDSAEEMVVRRWFSPDGNYMQIHPLSTLATCATGVHLNVSYLLPHRKPINATMYYQVKLLQFILQFN